MNWRISRSLCDEMLALAAASPDAEICGLLFGEADAINAFRHGANVSPDPQDSFEIDPAMLIAAFRAARAGGARPVGCFHSHPNGQTEPSVRDADGAHAGLPLWLILTDSIAAWQFDGKKFRPATLSFV